MIFNGRMPSQKLFCLILCPCVPEYHDFHRTRYHNTFTIDNESGNDYYPSSGPPNTLSCAIGLETFDLTADGLQLASHHVRAHGGGSSNVEVLAPLPDDRFDGALNFQYLDMSRHIQSRDPLRI